MERGEKKKIGEKWKREEKKKEKKKKE